MPAIGGAVSLRNELATGNELATDNETDFSESDFSGVDGNELATDNDLGFSALEFFGGERENFSTYRDGWHWHRRCLWSVVDSRHVDARGRFDRLDAVSAWHA